MEMSGRAMEKGAAPRAAEHWLLPGMRPLAWVVGASTLAAMAVMPMTHNTYLELLGEALFVGIVLLFAFRGAGAWRQRVVPRWLAQVLAIAVGAMVAPLVVQLVAAGGDISGFTSSKGHVRGYFLVTFGAAIIGSAIALGALFRERDAQARNEALHFDLLRERLERQAADARLRLLTAQIQPHFLLNTLANVQALVESGSPRAVPLFRSLTAYLRAAVPQLQQEQTSLGEEEKLVRAYLELMQMRMPDRLAFQVTVAPALRGVRLPPLALLTLVENAVRHGIDPCVDPGRIEVGARAEGEGVLLWVQDSGVGMAQAAGEGVGLSNLRQRLTAFDAAARFELCEVRPQGVRAEIHLRPVAPQP
jgi:sensor histidine kinase YesM